MGFPLAARLFLSSPLVSPVVSRWGAGGLEWLPILIPAGVGKAARNLWSSLPSAGGRVRKSPDGEWLGKKNREKKKVKTRKRTLAFMNGLARHLLLDVVTDTEFPAVSRVQKRVANNAQAAYCFSHFSSGGRQGGEGKHPLQRLFFFFFINILIY